MLGNTIEVIFNVNTETNWHFIESFIEFLDKGKGKCINF